MEQFAGERLNAFRGMLHGDSMALGMFSFIPSEALVEIAAHAGLDYLIFDTEHASYGVSTIERLVRTAQGAGITPVVRLAWPDPYLIARVLDTGANALLFARVSSAAEAERIVNATRLAPGGARGACPGSRSGQYYLMDRDEYTRRSDDVAIAVMIETREGLEEIEAIVAVDGIDGVAVGPVDLSFSLGVSGRDAPEVVEAIQRVTATARAAGVGVMASAKSEDELVRYLARADGPRVLWCATEAYQIGQHYQALVRRGREVAAKPAEALAGPA